MRGSQTDEPGAKCGWVEFFEICPWRQSQWFVVKGLSVAVALVFWGMIMPHVQGHFTCLVRELVHLPCPTCGMTRSLAAMLSLQPWEAIFYSPALALWLPLLAAYWVLGLALIPFGRAIRVRMTGVWLNRVRWFVVGSLAANWVYLLVIGSWRF